ncbi:MAG: hypothetical protein FWG73_07865 [Planctomycetaceae bacterium]|nr:hypothetical protein [Planctomycetaceae bacterium]
MKIRKIILKTLVLLLVFCLGYVLCVIEGMYHRDRMMDGIHFYAFDTKYRIERFQKGIEAGGRADVRPLVEVGPFFVFLLDDGERSWFSVNEISSHAPLVFLENQQQSKLLTFISSVENNMEMPRFIFDLRYSEDGIYERGRISVYGEDQKFERTYVDSEGTGIFDVMIVYENDVTNTYRLNGLVWEKVGDTNAEQKWNKRLRRNCNDGRHLRD